MLAKNRLTQNGLVGVDVSPDNPRNPDFRFAATDINEFGNVRMKWHTFSWNCPEGDIVLALEAYSRPSYTPASVLDTQLKYLEAIHHPENAAKEAEDLAAKLKASQAPKNEPQWLYFLCAQDEADVLLEERDWAQMRKQPNDIKMMKRMSREQGKWPVIIRVGSVSHTHTYTHTHSLSLSSVPQSSKPIIMVTNHETSPSNSPRSSATTNTAARSTNSRSASFSTARPPTKRRVSSGSSSRPRQGSHIATTRTSEFQCLSWISRGSMGRDCSAAWTRSVGVRRWTLPAPRTA
jgi:hypothetical protein